MLLIKKKDIFQEMATTLFLMKELVVHPGAAAFMPRLREKATSILETALPYTGILGDKQIKEFWESKPRRFNIDCGTDIIKGDTIRFVELVIDNRRKPSRTLGKRGITADVIAVNPPSDNPILLLRVIASGGVWDLNPGADIRRTMRSIIQFGISRCAWDDENKRFVLKHEALTLLQNRALDKKHSETIKDVAPTLLGRHRRI